MENSISVLKLLLWGPFAMQSVTYFSSLVFSCPPRASHNGFKQFLGLLFHKIFPQFWYFDTILVWKSKKMSSGNKGAYCTQFLSLNQIRFPKNLLCNICWLSVEHNAQLVIRGSDVILRQTVNIKTLLLLQKKIAHIVGRLFQLFGWWRVFWSCSI